MGMDPVTIGLGALALGAMMGGSQSAPNIPSPQAPAAPPQAAQRPDAGSVVQSMQGTGQAGGSPGVAETMLTGPGGIDPNDLKTQKGSGLLLGS